MTVLILSTDVITQHCFNAGFRGTSLEKMVAIVYAESAGNAHCTNLNTNGTYDWGLFQINSVHTGVTQALAFDPAWSARYAFKLSKSGTNFTPWVGYTNGNYAQYLVRATVSAQDIDTTIPPLNVVSLWGCRQQVLDGKSHAQVKILEKALIGEKMFPVGTVVDGIYDQKMIDAYKKLQLNVLHLNPAVCDGKPGTSSLNYLSKKYGFTWTQ